MEVPSCVACFCGIISNVQCGLEIYLVLRIYLCLIIILAYSEELIPDCDVL